VIIALPGVPIEMQEMISKQLVPLLKNKFKTKLTNHYKNKTILTTGITESALFEKLGNIEEIVGTGNLAFLPSPSGVRLRIDVNGKSLSEINKKINVIENKIRQKAGEYIYGTEDDSLEEIMGKRLKKMRLTLSIAESCTGGLLSSKITDVSGSSEYFIGGIITYSNAAKIKQLGVKKSTIVRYGAVSEQTAKEMAENVRKKFKTDIGLSITGIAGPKGGTKDKPVGLVWIGYSDYRLTSSRKFLFGMNRAKNKLRAGTAALYILNSNLFHYIY
jgi:nicotinamide-nucleotide amidase